MTNETCPGGQRTRDYLCCGVGGPADGEIRPGTRADAHIGAALAGLLCCAVTGLLVSPISWTHHWVWAVPLLVWLSVAAWRRRSAAWALAAAAAVFSDYTPLPWPGRPADPARMVASDLYVLFGLAVLSAVGVALARGRRRSPGPTGGP